MQEQAEQASAALYRLAHGPALTSLTARNEPPTVDDLRAQVKSALGSLRVAQRAMTAKDASGVEAALAEIRQAMGPVREASRKPAR